MESFISLIEECRKGKKNRIIHNASKDHAFALFSSLIDEARKTKEDVRIISGNLDRDFYAKLADSITTCMDDGVKVSVSVVSHEFDVDANTFAQAVKKHENGKLFVSPNDLEVEGPHFLVVGENKFRLELDHDQAKAIANFNDPKVGKTLVNVFNRISQLQSKHN